MKYFAGLLMLCLFFLGISTSCKKKDFNSKGNLEFSTDTLVFDTIFTTVGSTTQSFRIYNKENKPLKIEEIQLMGGTSSPFRINFDGLIGTEINDITIPADDSLYCFVEVTLEVNSQTNPMIIEDSIRFRTNGKDQYVKLVVWGQDAYFHNKEILSTQTWLNDKPHVIYGYAAVDSAETLTISAGTNIFLHKTALLYVYKSTLNIQGTLNQKVTLQGDRLENFYDDVSGQYYGIYFHEARPSTINHCQIKNATSGIHLFSEDAGNTDYTLTLSNTTITNSASYGLFIFKGARVKAENCVFAKNTIHSLLVLGGGDFNFNHCHLLGYSNSTESSPAVGISNSYYNPNSFQTEISAIDEGVITNSVIYGYSDYELAIDTINPSQTFNFGFQFTSNHIKSLTPFNGNYFSNNTYNIDPMFVNIQTGDYLYYSSSPLNNTANPLYPTLNGLDIIETPRNPISDKGAYEKL
jgi:hypothetical protein